MEQRHPTQAAPNSSTASTIGRNNATCPPYWASFLAMAAGKLQAVAGIAEPATEPAMSEFAARFERGELTVDEYLEALVSNAVALVDGKLPADRIEWLRGMLKDQLTSDPVLCERVRQATGREPQAR